MVGKRSPFTDQIWFYIKNCCILGIQAKDILNEICRVYGNNTTNFLFHLSHSGVGNLKVV